MHVQAKDWPRLPELLDGGEDFFTEVLERAVKNKTIAKHVNIETTLEAAYAACRGEHPYLKAAILNDSHLLIYSVAPLWWGDGTPWLLEQFFLRFSDAGTVGAAMTAIEDLAQEEGCTLILMGSTLSPSDKVMARLCERHGYTQQGLQLMKEI